MIRCLLLNKDGLGDYFLRKLCFWLLCCLIVRENVFPQENLKTLLNQCDYDQVIAATLQIVAQPVSARDHTALMLAGKAYYQKGCLLLAAYSAYQEIVSQYYSCKTLKDQKLQGPFMAFARGMLEVMQGNYDDALSHFINFRKSSGDKVWGTRATIWAGCLQEKLGKVSERDRTWQGVDWKTTMNISERLMVEGMLGLDSIPNALQSLLNQEIRDPILARNTLLIPGIYNRLNQSEKIKLFGLLQWKEPMYLKKSKDIEEKYYDCLALLAGGRCALSISRDIFSNSAKLLTDEEKKNYAPPPFILGWTSYLLDDLDATRITLEKDKDSRSFVLLGAVAFRTGNKQKAEEYWQPVDQGNDVRAQSWLGYLYARLGIKLSRAEELCKRFTDDLNEAQTMPQEFYSRYGGVLERRASAEQDFKKKNEIWSEARDVFSRGYRSAMEGRFSRDANDPEYSLLCCAAWERVDGTYMWNVNRTLYAARQKYNCCIPLHEAANLITICREIRIVK